MAKELQRPTRPLIVVLFAIVCMSTNSVYGQFPDDVEEGVVLAQPGNNAAIDDSNFYSWALGNDLGNMVSRNESGLRDRFQTLLSLEVDRIDRACSLSTDQKKKLQLAGLGDLERFFDQLAIRKRKFDELKHDQNNINEIFQDLQLIQNRLKAGIFGEDSLLYKSVKHTLDPQRFVKYEKAVHERQRFRYQVKVEWEVANLDKGIGLTSKQRHQFIDILVNETHPPRRFGQYDTYVILYQAARLPEEKLKPLFDDVQWELLTRQFKSALNMEPVLFSMGVIPEGIQPKNPKNWKGPKELPTKVFAEDKELTP